MAVAWTPTAICARSGLLVALPWPQTAIPVCCVVTGSTETAPARAILSTLSVSATATTTARPMATARGMRPDDEGCDGFIANLLHTWWLVGEQTKRFEALAYFLDVAQRPLVPTSYCLQPVMYSDGAT